MRLIASSFLANIFMRSLFWESGTLLKKDSGKDCPPGKDNISQRVGGSHLFEVLCLAFPFTSSPCLECQKGFVRD